MWFPGHTSSETPGKPPAVLPLQSHGILESQEEIRNALNATHCYDIMRNSTKIVLFETTISFQLAFYALIEHEADAAPIWDPVRKAFVGIMTPRDYVRSLHIFRQKGMSFVELATRSIAEVQSPALSVFQHPDFQPVDAEDTVYQLCLQFLRGDADYIPVVDPDNGNLVAVLGLLDILFLLTQISQDFPNLFSFTLQQLAIGSFEGILTSSSSAFLSDVLGVMDEKGLAFVPVLEEGTGHLVGLYQRSDIGFMTKATDPDAVISSFSSLRIDTVLKQQSSADASGVSVPATTPSAPLPASVTCTLKSTLKDILETMMAARSSAISCVDDSGKFLGILSVRDIVNYYCHN